jgi:hypothetical protein
VYEIVVGIVGKRTSLSSSFVALRYAMNEDMMYVYKKTLF